MVLNCSEIRLGSNSIFIFIKYFHLPKDRQKTSDVFRNWMGHAWNPAPVGFFLPVFQYFSFISIFIYAFFLQEEKCLNFSRLMTYIYIYIYICRTAALTSRCCILYIFIQQIYVLNILNKLHTLRFFLFKMPFISKCYLFGPCIIHILNTGCAKI